MARQGGKGTEGSCAQDLLIFINHNEKKIFEEIFEFKYYAPIKAFFL